MAFCEALSGYRRETDLKAEILLELDEYVHGRGRNDRRAHAIRPFLREEARKLLESWPESELRVMLKNMAEGKEADTEPSHEEKKR